MAEGTNSRTDEWVKLAQIISVIIGVVISVGSFNETRKKEAEARLEASKTEALETQKYADQKQADAYRAQIEAAKPFLELRQKRYQEAAHATGILSQPSLHTKEELAAARKQFSELYWGDLSLVEDNDVALAMQDFAASLGQVGETPQQTASIILAHKLRVSLAKSWAAQDVPSPK